MRFIELTITVMLKKHINFQDCGYIIGKNINKSMLLDKDLKEIHPKRQYKHYVFNSFYPIERDKFYKKDRLYIFRIRSLSDEFINKIDTCLCNLKSDDFNVISTSKKYIEKIHIKELYTQTPLIITIDDKPWLQIDGDVDLFKSRIEDNLEKKYKDFFNGDIDIKGNFIKSVEFKNRKPMHYNYKNGIKLLANKVSIQIEDNEEAQKVAFLARAVGLGEKNSAMGAGFCE
ncbi:CRISPR-associated endoribonuclease Cas6 [Clostridium sp. Marseille-Q2269]|uniref:CRISPR-associated endoribonuclease Cas6 n=1 Tax=Clostridium sp. Marseille-Q2269 TaxID=2942205 RepID=UPI00207302C5|nr:CRISPR-associated endoribonuclease Cas6 [Clostridium sp. Marseille-Q2269]